MDDVQDALRQRYRSALADRTQRVVELLHECRSTDDQEARQALLGELHTLKGESRMLGLSALATLTHGIEDRIIEGTPDWEMLSAAADAISLCLAPDTPDALSADLLQTACEALGLTVDDPMGERSAVAGSAEEPSAPDPARKGYVSPQERWIQVEAGLVDQLCETLAGLTTSFSLHAANLNRSNHAANAQQLRDVQSEADELKTQLSDALLLCLGLRLTPLEPTLARLASHVRVLAKERGKPVDVVVSAHGVRIERVLLEILREPLLHLCTNAVAHGIESAEAQNHKSVRGKIELRAESSGSTVVVRVSDNGKGIDTDHLRQLARKRGLPDSSGHLGDYQLLFESGFSTHENTDQIAGRGVGLDVVKRQIESAQGTIEVSSVYGQGTTFSLHVPAALTQEHLIICQVGTALFGIPAHLVLAIQGNEGTLPPTYRHHEQALPLRSLPHILARPETPGSTARILLLKLFGQNYAVWAPEVLGNFELLRRPTTAALKAKTGFAASAQMDDGQLVLILDPRALQLGLENKTTPSQLSRPEERQVRRVLVVDDSVVVRDLISEILIGAGYETRGAENGFKAVQVMEQFQPGLVISDIEMPQMDGFQLLEALRRRSETLPVILVTARSSTADRQRAATLGASAYVAKGEFESSSLLQIVARYYPGAP